MNIGHKFNLYIANVWFHILFPKLFLFYDLFSADVSGTTSGYRNEMIIVYSNGGKKKEGLIISL